MILVWFKVKNVLDGLVVFEEGKRCLGAAQGFMLGPSSETEAGSAEEQPAEG